MIVRGSNYYRPPVTVTRAACTVDADPVTVYAPPAPVVVTPTYPVYPLHSGLCASLTLPLRSSVLGFALASDETIRENPLYVSTHPHPSRWGCVFSCLMRSRRGATNR